MVITHHVRIVLAHLLELHMLINVVFVTQIFLMIVRLIVQEFGEEVLFTMNVEPAIMIHQMIVSKTVQVFGVVMQ